MLSSKPHLVGTLDPRYPLSPMLPRIKPNRAVPSPRCNESFGEGTNHRRAVSAVIVSEVKRCSSRELFNASSTLDSMFDLTADRRARHPRVGYSEHDFLLKLRTLPY